MTIIEMDGNLYLFEADLPKGIIECPTCKGRIVVVKRVYPMPDGSLLVNENRAVCCWTDAIFAAQMGGFSECDISVMCPPMTEEQLEAMFEELDLFLARSFACN